MTERVPAWKRMGLKLKNGSGGAAGSAPEEAGSGSSAVGPVGHPSRTTTTNDSTTTKNNTPGRPSHKRKLDPLPSDTDLNTNSPSHVHNNSINIHKSKKPRRESSSQQQTPKKVTFEEPSTTPSTKTPGKSPNSKPVQKHSKPAATPNQETPKQRQADKKTKGKEVASPRPAKAPQPPTDIKPALEYLRQWKTSRESWKFNKNHQSALIKHAFEPDLIPAEDIEIFYEYIRDLKGFVRTRLRETAMEIKMRDVEDGYAAFPESDDAMDLDEQQSNYDSILADILRRRRQTTKRKFFAEAQYVAESADVNGIIVHRLVKRMRAEMVLEELSDGESTDSSSGSTASSKTIVASDSTNATSSTSASTAAVQQTARAKVNEMTGKRRRKLRVNMEDSSSSESESESDSGDDTSSSEDESDSDEAEEVRPDNYDTSSSSSSSSSGESDSEDDSEDDNDD